MKTKGAWLLGGTLLSYATGNLLSVGARIGGESAFLVTKASIAGLVAGANNRRGRFDRLSVTVGLLQGLHSLAFFVAVRTLSPFLAVAVLATSQGFNLLLAWSEHTGKPRARIAAATVVTVVSAIGFQITGHQSVQTSILGIAAIIAALTLLVLRLRVVEQHAHTLNANAALLTSYAIIIVGAATAGSWGPIAAIAAVAAGINTWVGHRLLYEAQRYVPAFMAASVNAASSVVTAAGAWLLFNKAMTAPQVIWALVLVAGLGWLTWLISQPEADSGGPLVATT